MKSDDLLKRALNYLDKWTAINYVSAEKKIFRVKQTFYRLPKASSTINFSSLDDNQCFLQLLMEPLQHLLWQLILMTWLRKTNRRILQENQAPIKIIRSSLAKLQRSPKNSDSESNKTIMTCICQMAGIDPDPEFSVLFQARKQHFFQAKSPVDGFKSTVIF